MFFFLICHCKITESDLRTYHRSQKIISSFRLNYTYFFVQFTAQIPDRPEFPDGTDIRSCIALGSRTKPTIQWLVFRNEPTMMDWLRSISDTVLLLSNSYTYILL